MSDRATIEAAFVALVPGMAIPPAGDRNLGVIAEEVRRRAPACGHSSTATFDLANRLSALARTVFDAADDGRKWMWCELQIEKAAAEIAAWKPQEARS